MINSTEQPKAQSRDWMLQAFEHWYGRLDDTPFERDDWEKWLGVWSGAWYESEQRCLDAIMRIRSHYSEDVLLPESDSPDAKAADWARRVCDNIVAEIQKEP